MRESNSRAVTRAEPGHTRTPEIRPSYQALTPLVLTLHFQGTLAWEGPEAGGGAGTAPAAQS